LAGSPARPRAAGTSAAARALLRSRELWATIDVCNAPDQPNVLGVRGSMPGDAQAHDTMYMRFRLQYLDKTTMRWVNLAASGASTPFLAVGGGASSRQDGSSFVIAPVAGQPAFMLRGVVAFQWRRGRTVLESITRPTTAGHQALAGADPAGFSAASCQIG
ncbi:MAG TPA: hypothetical protein VN772_00765, partial [Solirubrobacteraceae bacterium]|nr:hypothetical protein [Solirubrobacteraceae bacterium]